MNVDLDEAFKWFKRAAGENVVVDTNKIAGTMRMLGFEMKLRALHQLYKYYLSGECPEQQPQLAKALYYLRRAAELGDLESQRELGRVYMTGSCTGYKDLGKAERWLEKAANKGDPESHKVLNYCILDWFECLQLQSVHVNFQLITLIESNRIPLQVQVGGF